MPDAPSLPHTGQAPAPATAFGRPGTLVLVVGPSGAGKDTLIDAARTQFGSADGVVFCKRFITRAEQIGEQHTPLSTDEFARMRASGAFLLAWEAHGLHYGIGAGTLTALREGRTVVTNVSRMIIAEARRLWPHTVVVRITARPDVRLARLSARNREPAEAVALRLRRGDEIPLPPADWLHEINNSASLAEAVAQFNAIIARTITATGGSAPVA